MYERFYGLSEHPFNLTPDPDFLFLNQNFREALDQITYAVTRGEVFAVLIGDVGTGKTTLCWALLTRIQKTVRTALILNPLLDPEDLLRAIIQDFSIKPVEYSALRRTQMDGETADLQDSSWLQELKGKQLVDELNRYLLESAESDVRNVLVVDEAQNLSVECLEQLRVLSNLETSKCKLLQIILSGQLELDQKLNLPQLRQLKQRMTVRCSLKPLSEDDMTQYIYHRLWRAGASRNLSFSKGALRIIFMHSLGYPRLINVICDRALLAGYNNRSWIINNKIVRTALAQLGMSGRKYSWWPSPFPLKRVLTAAAILVILTGLFYIVRHWNLLHRLVNHPQTIKSMPANIETNSSNIPRPPPPTTNRQPAPEVARAHSANADPAFFLQVHSLDNQNDALRASAELTQKGYPAFERIFVNAQNSRWYVVYVGPFADSEAAKEAAASLLRREALPTILRCPPSAEMGHN